MSVKHFVLMTIFCTIIAFPGCGTIGARATTMNPPPFAGLRADFEALHDVVTNKQKIEPFWYWLGVPLVSGIILADIPVSAFFDLYCLPWDLSRHEEPAEELHVTIEKQPAEQ